MSKTESAVLAEVFAKLGDYLANPDEQLYGIINSQLHHNAWFTPANVEKAVKAIGQMLNPIELTEWLKQYTFSDESKKVGLILAGNIPLVGFHDVLCVLTSGNFALIKASSQDNLLIKYILQKLTEIDESFSSRYSFVEKLENFDAVIATGSNNTSRYFEYYFGRVPNIIRKNRSSIAVLSGNETATELHRLGHDIFDYYGLGCRNVSKLLVPESYDFRFFFESIKDYEPVIHHHKYNNNYDYNKSIFLVNGDEHLDNGFLLLKKDDKLTSPLAVLFYSTYTNVASAEKMLNEESEKIQIVVSSMHLNIINQKVAFGQSQHPKLWDYADGIDTMEFLSKL